MDSTMSKPGSEGWTGMSRTNSNVARLLSGLLYGARSPALTSRDNPLVEADPATFEVVSESEGTDGAHRWKLEELVDERSGKRRKRRQ